MDAFPINTNPLDNGLVYDHQMKTADITERQAAEEAKATLFGQCWPWLVPGRRAENNTVTLLEGVIEEDGTVIPAEGFEDVLEELMD